MDRYTQIAHIYDRFLTQGNYQKLALDPRTYPVTKVIPEALTQSGITDNTLTVLDLACGPGTFKMCSNFADYHGVDLSPAMLLAAEDAGYTKTTLSEICEFARNAPDKSYDLVSCLSAAYFLSFSELDELLVNICRISRQYYIITLDGVPPEECEAYAKQGVPMYNHVGLKLKDTIWRQIVPGWKAAVNQAIVPMEFIVGRVD